MVRVYNMERTSFIFTLLTYNCLCSNLLLLYDLCKEHYCVGIDEEGSDQCTNSRDCRLLVTAHKGEDKENFRIFYNAYLSNAEKLSAVWLAVGISDDDRMGNDSVVECHRLADGRVSDFYSVNVGQRNIVSKRKAKGIKFNRIKDNDGRSMIECSWSNEARTSTVAEEKTSYSVEIDYYKKQYYLLLAYGDLEPIHNSKRKHANKARIVGPVIPWGFSEEKEGNTALQVEVLKQTVTLQLQQILLIAGIVALGLIFTILLVIALVQAVYSKKERPPSPQRTKSVPLSTYSTTSASASATFTRCPHRRS